MTDMTLTITRGCSLNLEAIAPGVPVKDLGSITIVCQGCDKLDLADLGAAEVEVDGQPTPSPTGSIEVEQPDEKSIVITKVTADMTLTTCNEPGGMIQNMAVR